AIPASVNACFATRWYSDSMSIEVRMPPGAIPSNRCSPETPVPVPISTTLRAVTLAARKASIAPAPTLTGSHPMSAARSRAAAAWSFSLMNSSAYGWEVLTPVTLPGAGSAFVDIHAATGAATFRRRSREHRRPADRYSSQATGGHRMHPDTSHAASELSWDETVRTYGDRVYTLAFRLSGNKHDAEDITQEVFIRVFKSLDRYEPGSFTGWLHRITTNVFLDMVRRRSRVRINPIGDDAAQTASNEPTPEQTLQDAEL